MLIAKLRISLTDANIQYNKGDELGTDKKRGTRERFWKRVFSKESAPSAVGLVMEFSDWRVEAELGDRICKQLWPDGKYPTELNK